MGFSFAKIRDIVDKNSICYCFSWQDTTLEGGELKLPVEGAEAAQVCADLPALAAETELVTRVLSLQIFNNADFERLQRLSGAALGD